MSDAYAALAATQAANAITGRSIKDPMTVALAAAAQVSAAWRPAHVGLVDGASHQGQMQTRANSAEESAWGSVVPGTSECPPSWNQAVVTGTPGAVLPG